jgi:hypothetical protein
MDIALNRVYEHFKGGRWVPYGKLKCRDLEEFTEMVAWPDGTQRPRLVVSEEA